MNLIGDFATSYNNIQEWVGNFEIEKEFMAGGRRGLQVMASSDVTTLVKKLLTEVKKQLYYNQLTQQRHPELMLDVLRTPSTPLTQGEDVRKEAELFGQFLLMEQYKSRNGHDWCRYENGDIQTFTTKQLYELFKGDELRETRYENKPSGIEKEEETGTKCNCKYPRPELTPMAGYFCTICNKQMPSQSSTIPVVDYPKDIESELNDIERLAYELNQKGMTASAAQLNLHVNILKKILSRQKSNAVVDYEKEAMAFLTEKNLKYLVTILFTDTADRSMQWTLPYLFAQFARQMSSPSDTNGKLKELIDKIEIEEKSTKTSESFRNGLRFARLLANSLIQQ